MWQGKQGFQRQPHCSFQPLCGTESQTAFWKKRKGKKKKKKPQQQIANQNPDSKVSREGKEGGWGGSGVPGEHAWLGVLGPSVGSPFRAPFCCCRPVFLMKVWAAWTKELIGAVWCVLSSPCSKIPGLQIPPADLLPQVGFTPRLNQTLAFLTVKVSMFQISLTHSSSNSRVTSKF